MSEKIFLYPLWIRIWHIINALLCLILILTGISMQYAVDIIGLDTLVSMHNVCGIILTINYLMFFFGNIASDNGKYYRFQVKGLFARILKQAQYYAFGLFKNEKPPFPINKERKFNPLQKITYWMIMYLFVPLVFISGLGLLFPETIIPDVFGTSGLLLTDIVHIIAGFIISIFLIVHLYIITIGTSPTGNFKSMINGWHEAH